MSSITLDTMTEAEREQHQAIVNEAPTAQQIEAAKRFIESCGIQYTTTALLAIGEVMASEYDNSEMAGVLWEAAAEMAKIEAVTL